MLKTILPIQFKEEFGAIKNLEDKKVHVEKVFDEITN